MQSLAFQPKLILVPTDFSASAHTAVETASELARQYHSAVYLLNIIPMLPIVDAAGYSTAIFPEQEYSENARRYADGRLAQFAKVMRGQGIKADFAVEIGNDVVGNIMMVL